MSDFLHNDLTVPGMALWCLIGIVPTFLVWLAAGRHKTRAWATVFVVMGIGGPYGLVSAAITIVFAVSWLLFVIAVGLACDFLVGKER